MAGYNKRVVHKGIIDAVLSLYIGKPIHDFLKKHFKYYERQRIFMNEERSVGVTLTSNLNYLAEKLQMKIQGPEVEVHIDEDILSQRGNTIYIRIGHFKREYVKMLRYLLGNFVTLLHAEKLDNRENLVLIMKSGTLTGYLARWRNGKQ